MPKPSLRSRSAGPSTRQVKIRAACDPRYGRVDDVKVTESSDLERLYREMGRRLWWALLAYSGDPEVASDAVSEAFARALGAAGSIRDPSAWAWKVAFRVATTELRERRRDRTIRETSYEIDEEAAAVLVALDRLTRRQRAVFVLFYLDDQPAKKIAERLGMSPATVSVHLHRARRRLRDLLEERDD